MKHSIRYAKEEDMRLAYLTHPYTTPSEIPLSYTIGGVSFKGIPREFSPSVTRLPIDGCITQFTVTGTHPAGLRITATALLYRDFPVSEWIATFTNTSDTPSPIIENLRIETLIPGTEAVLEHASGDTCGGSGYKIFRDDLSAPLSLFPVNGLPCQGASPYMRLCLSGCGVNLMIGFPAGWIAEFAETDGGVLVSVGQKRCHMSILPGETIRTPRLSMMAYSGDDRHARNLYRQWYFAHILPKENGHPIPPLCCEHVFGYNGPEFTGATEESQLNGLSEYIRRDLKPDVWWIDAGWYPCDGDWPRTGTWEHDPKRFPHGLAPIGDLCDKNGVRLLLWMEPERVRMRGTWLGENRPEWILTLPDAQNGLLDLGNPEALAWLIDHVDGLIKEYHVRIYRQDFNFDPAPYWEAAEAEDRIGALENRHVQGYLAYWDALIDRNPGLFIDSCASGGRRNDLDTMRRAVTLHYTDVGYGEHPTKQLQHRYMFEWIPYFRAHTMSWDNDEGSYDPRGNKPIDRFMFHNAMTPSITNMTTWDDSDEIYDISYAMMPIWRRAAEIELRADYYPLTVCRKDLHDWYAMQFDDPDEGDGFVQVIRNIGVEDDTYLLRMEAVDPDAEYFFENMETGDMMQLSGKDLLPGIPLTLEKRSGVLWFYHKVTF